MPYKDLVVAKEKARERGKRNGPAYRAKNKEKIGEAWDYWYEKNKEKVKADQKVRYRKDVVWQLIIAARCRCKKNGWPCDLERGDLVLPDVCPVFGTPFVLMDRTFGPSIDRVDPDKGYVKGNVHVISFRANRLKNNATLEELELLVAYIKAHNEEQEAENQYDPPLAA